MDFLDRHGAGRRLTAEAGAGRLGHHAVRTFILQPAS
jgi:hypothetical protein